MKLHYSIFTPGAWTDYELIDSGNGEKLERFGQYTVVRPEPKALWHPTQSRWNPDARYTRAATGGGSWHAIRKIPSTWNIRYKDLVFQVKPTGFKHVGVFPEQAAVWDIITSAVKSAKRPINVLNLFAYTGGSTLAAAAAGASVTHVDSEKEVLTWARENAIASGLKDRPIRWIPDDAVAFVKREIKRGNRYDAIIMDPPKFGRGSADQVWKIERDLPKLCELCRDILSPKPLFVLINAYAVSLSAIAIRNVLAQMVKGAPGTIEAGELCLPHSSSEFLLPASIAALFQSS